MSNYEEDFFDDRDNGDDDLPSNLFYNGIIVFAIIGFLGTIVFFGKLAYNFLSS